MKCRFNNSDLVIYIGTFMLGDSALEMTPEPQLIVDLGANVGYTALNLRRCFPKAWVLAVEPGDENFEVLRENLGSLERMILRKTVVTQKEGQFRLSNPEDIAMSQWYKEDTTRDDGTIQGVTVGSLLSEFDEEVRPVLVKMDIEGAEKEIFLNDTGWLDRVDVVLVEPHGEETREIIESVLKDFKFHVGNLGEKILGYRDGIFIDAEKR